MEQWHIATLAVCSFGFFKELKPSEPFLTPYLKEWKNETSEEINNQIYPVWTYSCLPALFVVFLLTDLLRYKPVIIFGGLCYITTWLLLLFAQGVLAMQFMQFSYGLATATEIAYYAYIYAVVPADHYRKVSGFTRTACLTGKFVAYVLAQLLVSFQAADYFVLNCMSMGSVSMAFLIALMLPRVKNTVYFHRDSFHGRELRSPTGGSRDGMDRVDVQNHEDDLATASMSSREESFRDAEAAEAKSQYCNNPYMFAEIDASSLAYSYGESLSNYSDTSHAGEQPEVPRRDSRENNQTGHSSWCQKFRDTLLLLLQEVKSIYTDRSLLVWSVWWVLASCGNFQVFNYIQNLWDEVSPHRDNPHIYNGAIEAAATCLGALSALVVGYLPVNWDRQGEWLLALVSGVNSALLVIMARTTNVWVAYCFSCLFGASFQLAITIATFQIAVRLSLQRYGLVFGLNTFLALALETILTVIMVDKRGLDTPVRIQFTVYGVYFGIIAVVFLSKTIYNCYQHRRSVGSPWYCCWRSEEDGVPVVEE